MLNKYWLYVIGVIALLTVGFFGGRLTINEKTIIKTETVYKKGAVIKDTIIKPQPYAVIKPYEVLKIKLKHDTIYTKVDSSKIVSDYLLTRKYALDFSSDTTGVFKVDVAVNKNQLISAISTIRPIIKTTTIEKITTKKQLLQVYAMIGTSPDLSTNQLQVGVNLGQKYMIGVSGMRFDNNSFGYTINVGIIF